MRSLRFAPIFRKALLAAALTCLAVPAVANVITDWDAKAVAVAASAPLGLTLPAATNAKLVQLTALSTKRSRKKSNPFSGAISPR